jgi:5-methylcytosine-specific restriction protein A
VPIKAPRRTLDKKYPRPRERRGHSAARGYGDRWRRYRTAFLSHPENACCRHCAARGRITPATDVDHVTPITGPNDPLFWDPANHQPLCHRCHAIKTRADQAREP